MTRAKGSCPLLEEFEMTVVLAVVVLAAVVREGVVVGR